MAAVIQFTNRRGVIRTLSDNGWPIVVSALLIVGSASCFVLSIKHTSVANTVFILSARPITTALVSWLFLREKTSKALAIAIAGVICGIYIVVKGALGTSDLLGDCFAIIAVICLGLNGTLWRRYKEMSRFAVVGLGGFFIALVMFIPSTPSSFSLNTWLIMGCMGLASAPLGRVLNALSSRYIPAAEMATITLISVVLAPIWAFIIFKEQPPVTTLTGGAVILISIASFILFTSNGLIHKQRLTTTSQKE
ncbi:MULTISPECIES: DMT family transporter [unclassified Pseudodesulfovibrio]|uniref:DMT family transporter n=1 Tax=unclassified Pseudodesulfovibrio TaxID=2661612 RepID=UPI0019D44F8B|nr:MULTISPECIES: DMT family transporter [unclassified Pseudodesulfovibrio]MCJ2162937.1 DMT family transporter [Pseudodesulfovibrio sp. S3-i]